MPKFSILRHLQTDDFFDLFPQRLRLRDFKTYLLQIYFIQSLQQRCGHQFLGTLEIFWGVQFV